MKEELNQITEKIIGAAIEVHRELGPGLLESAYEACLVHELRTRGIFVESQKELPVVYKGIQLDCGYKIDLLVEREVIVELKAVEQFHPIHHAQVINYLKLSNKNLGLLLNFNVKLLKDGIKRIILD
jgi:GxxExxY protein